MISMISVSVLWMMGNEAPEYTACLWHVQVCLLNFPASSVACKLS